MLKKILSVLLLVSSASLSAQSLWSDFSETQLSAQPGSVRHIVPERYRSVQLDLSQLQPLLASAPERFSATAADEAVVLSLPLPDGQTARFLLTESPVMAPGLQAKYPEIRCYTGTGIDDPSASLKCDLTPQGFHAMIRSAVSGTVFIDPYRQGDREHYIAYFKKDFHSNKQFHCGVEDDDLEKSDKASAPVPDLQGDCQFRRYRLALACTGEYAQFHGGTTPLVLAAMATTVNRINSVYERDMSISLQLITNNNLLVFLNAATDGYTNNNGFTMLVENQNKCTNVIGSANYDIGHVFSTGGGGVASVGVICGNSVKARGVTGTNQPIGDPFDIDFVSHEMGHQFGANHTFNSSCDDNVNPGTAFEPGSGSTIMAYAGVCPPFDVQNHSDVYFHAASLSEIGQYVTTSQGNLCPVKINTGNTAPVVQAGSDYLIPKSTPFALTATGSDADGDPLTYCWEQMDNEIATAPPVSTSSGGPLFRSFDPVASPTRYFPRLTDLITNTNTTWEELPGVARVLNFRVTARDNKASGGCTEEDDLKLTVISTAGPFVVTSPNTAVTWLVGDAATVSWDVADTKSAPISCAQVRITLSTDGGNTYPIVLAASVANNGSAVVDVPNAISSTCRVRVEAVGNVFFDISNQNFEIKAPGAPTFILNTSAASAFLCAGDSLAYTGSVEGIFGFSGPVQLSLSGAPADAQVQISSTLLASGETASILLTNLNTPGNYTLVLTAVSGNITRTRSLDLGILDSSLPAPGLQSPADGEGSINQSPVLSWASVGAAFSYQIQVATNPNFAAGALIFDQELSDLSVKLGQLDTAKVYYWRVMAKNICGQSEFSSVFAFQTGRPECGFSVASTNVPLAIPNNAVIKLSSVLNIPSNRYVADVNLSVQVNHTWVGDLIGRLRSPAGQSALLFDQPGYPATSSGCSGNNLALTLDDEAAQSAAALESTCGNNPAISGTFKPMEAFDRFDNSLAQGNWALELDDNFDEDGGSLTAWSLSFCFFDTVPSATLLVNNPLGVLSGGSANITISKLIVQVASGNPAQGVFTLLSVPQHGTLRLNGQPLAMGSSFTQADIVAGLLQYSHNGDAATADDFQFDVVDESTNEWIHHSTFLIQILQNDLVVTATPTALVACSGGSNGTIEVAVSGGTPPFAYSLNGGAPQFINSFSNLSAGTYTVVVTDQNTFTASSNAVVLDNPTVLALSVSVTADDITATASGGTGALTYSIDGQAFQTNPVFSNQANGSYTLTVKDANGCTATAGAVVSVPPLEVLLSITDIIACAGDANGAISVQVSGGVPPYSFSLDGVDFQTENTFSALAAGSYTVVVVDDSGNSASSDKVTLDDPLPLQVSASTLNDDISVLATGGTGLLSYSIDGQLFQQEPVFENLANGFYTVTVRDAKGCTATAEAVVAVDALIANLNISATNLCSGDSSGMLQVTAAGGVEPYSYSLNGLDFQSSNTFDHLGAGTYSVVVRDDSGNTTSSNVVALNDPPALKILVAANLNTVTATVTGGTGLLEYSLNGGDFQSDSHFVQLPNGIYIVTVRDANGCMASEKAVVNVPDLQILEITANGAIACFGGTLSITVSAAGGIPPYQYSLDGGAFQDEQVFENVTGAVHTVTVRDANGQTTEADITIAQPDPLSAQVLVTNNDVAVMTSGGTLPYTYSLNGGPVQAEATFSNLSPGAYAVVVTDAQGCSTVVSFDMTYLPMSYSLQAVDPSCFEGTNGGAVLLISGGTGPYTLNGSILGLSAGMYEIVATDATGDTLHISFILNDPPALTLSVVVSNDTITATASGGTGTLGYSLDGVNYQTSPAFSQVPNGTYTVWVRDANGCISMLENVIVNYVGTYSPLDAWGLQVQPNPGPGLFGLQLHNAPAGAILLEVFDVAGRRLQQQVVEAVDGQLTTTLDLTGLPAAVYTLRLRNGVASGTVRLVVAL
ncbi:MAG: proprotein convertase P-domain-containing protein [Saprospiraceae bacterium]|nr:proprotein convertase P-domain-containing protein [Saprospiraceae bacterium]